MARAHPTAMMLAAFVIFAASGASDALEYTVRDYNTMQYIQYVNVTVYNTTVEYSVLTDAYGYASQAIPDGNWSIHVWRSGYFPYDSSLNATNTTVMQYVNLNPSSSAGIVRLRFSDLTLSNHPFCLYTTDNMRLVDCYEMNGSIVTMHVNTNYTIKPLIRQSDLLTTPSGLANYGRAYVPMMIGILFLLALVFTMIYYVWRLRK